MTRKIPRSWFQAQARSTTMAFITASHRFERPHTLGPGERRIAWFVLPDFQRPAVWTVEQKARFVESCWMGLPIGSFVWNDAPGTRFDQWLLDGQQRVTAVVEYMHDAFPVFGLRFSELGEVDLRVWDMSISFPCLTTNLKDEKLLREVYDRLAYGGTPHEPKPTSASV